MAKDEPWHATEQELLRKLHAEGLLAQQISRRLGRTTNEVKAELARLGLTPNTVQHWTEEEDRLLMYMLSHGNKAEKIAQRLKRPEGAVKVRIQVLTSGTATFGKKKARIRPCMNCEKPFRSEGPHNRLCVNCRHESSNPFETPAVVRR